MAGSEAIQADDFNPRIIARIANEKESLKEREKHQAEADEKFRRKKAEEEAARERNAEENNIARELLEKEATKILTEGKPFDYFIKTFSLDHEGDLTAARAIALTFASSSVANGDGLHTYLSGSSGRGKTHAAETMFKQLPKEFNYNRSFSDRYLYYASNTDSGLKEGVVVLVDDQTMSESVQELFKVAVSKYADPNGVTYGTVLSQKAITLQMPGRISWVLLKVDDPGDDQVMNRLIQARIQETEEKIKQSADRIQLKYRDLKKRSVKDKRWEIQVCERIWSKVKAFNVAVEVPCAGQVIFADNQNLRNHELFFNLVMAHAVIHRCQRKEIGKTEDNIPIILATEADYKEARLTFESLHEFGGQKHNTLKNEDVVIAALLSMNPDRGLFTISEVAEKAGISYKTAYRAIIGRENSGKVRGALGGLLEKCPFIQKRGKRGQFDTEIETEYIDRNASKCEIVRKESLNEDIYHVDIEALKHWKEIGDPVKLTPGFKWEDSSI